MDSHCPLDEYIDLFKDYLLLRNKSKRTISEYSYDLHVFANFLELKGYKEHINSLNDISGKIIEKFLVFLRSEKINYRGETLSPTTINRKYYALCSFFNFLIKKRHLVGENPTQYVDVLDTTITSTHTYLSVTQSKELLLSIRTPYKIRDNLMVELMLLLGLRVSEVSKLNLSDINLDNESITIHGKGDKERTLPLSPHLVKNIKEYMDYRKDHFSSTEDKNALFLSRNHKRITVRQIQKIVERIVGQIGLNDGKENEPSRKKITSHKLRHTFGTLSAQNGTSVLTLKEILGHSSVNTTNIYTKSSNAQIKEAIDNNPIYSSQQEEAL